MLRDVVFRGNTFGRWFDRNSRRNRSSCISRPAFIRRPRQDASWAERKKRSRKVRASLAISFLAGGAPVFSFTIARTYLSLVCRGDNVVQESRERIRDVYLFKLLNIFQSLTIEVFLNTSHSCVFYDISVQTFMYNIKTKYIWKRWSYISLNNIS